MWKLFYKLSRLSIKAKVLALVLGMMLVQSITQIANLYRMTHLSLDSAKEEYQQYAIELGEKIGAQFYERYGDVQAFAVNETITNMDAAKMPGLLDTYGQLYGIYDLILVVDKNGKYVASNTIDTNGKAVKVAEMSKLNFAETPWFKEAMAKHYTEDKPKGFTDTYFEDMMFDPMIKLAFGEERVGTSFTTLIKSKGEVLGVITNRAAGKWIEGEIKNFYSSLSKKNIPSSEFAIIDKTGTLILEHKPKDHEFKNEMFYDSNNLFKYKPKSPVFASAQEGKTGGMINVNARSNIEQLAGYHNIDNPKWIKAIGWSVIVRGDRSEVMAVADAASKISFLSALIIALITFFVSIYVTKFLSQSLSTMSDSLSMNSTDLASAANIMASSSTELSSASTEQAAALQQTMAAVDEINAMVEKNSEAANRSIEVSQVSREAAERGKKIVGSMITAIQDIDTANEEIATQMNHTNQELSDITKLINDIGAKTKVINEIVFQTKLLSFNASVEAARAGEYGKGFAVVAEEVGSLAQMSGAAAKEITSMLDDSVRKVDEIVLNTRERVDKMMQTSKNKVRSGSQTAQDCNQALDEILENVVSVDGLVSEIATASREQATGIREISKAVGEMDSATQQNSAVANSTSTAAEQLKRQSEELKGIVSSLVEIVHGDGVGIQKVATQNTVSAMKSVAKQSKSKSVAKVSSTHKPQLHAVHSTPRVSTNKSVKKSMPPQKSKGFLANATSKLSNHIMKAKLQAQSALAPRTQITQSKAVGENPVPSADDPGFEE